MKTKNKVTDLKIPQGKSFQVEFTSVRPDSPEQIAIHAETQAEAVMKALAGHPPRLRPYDKKTDKTRSYVGWAFFTISVDEGVDLEPLVLKAKDRKTVDYDGSGIFCESNECEATDCHRCFPRHGCEDHDKCGEFTNAEVRDARRQT